MSANFFDLAVVGGGPAGLAAAIEAAAQGLRVVLLEAKTYPHHKMCGEFLSPECRGFLSHLGLDPAGLGGVRIDRARITAPSGAAWEERLPGPGLGLSRYRLDAALAERARQAGVDVREGTPVRSVTGSLDAGFSLETGGGEMGSRVVIGAQGKRSSLDRALGRAFLHRPQPFVAMKAHFYGPPVPGRVELHVFPGGYCGISEIEADGRVVCFLAREDSFRRFRQDGDEGAATDAVDRYVQWMARQNERLGRWLAEAERIHPRWISIAQVPFCPKPALEHDILMAGDAAGLIVPLAGNGISMALEGGILAARSAAAYLHGKARPAALRRAYPEAWNQRFGARLRLGRALQPLMLSPALASPALRLLSTFPALGRALVTRTRGRYPARSPGAHRSGKHEEKID